MTQNWTTSDSGASTPDASEPPPAAQKRSDGPVRKQSIPDFERYQRDSLELHKRLDLDDEPLAEEEEDECQPQASREKPWPHIDQLQLALAKFREKPAAGPRAPRHLEYELRHMYPEMRPLTEGRRRDWDFRDPNLIRALWLESKTQALAEWKCRHGRVAAARRPKIEVRGTHTTEARLEFRRQQQRRREQRIEQEVWALRVAGQAPTFEAVEIASNATTDMRLQFKRNDPPVPRYYIEHFHRYKKPPFRKAIPVGRRC